MENSKTKTTGKKVSRKKAGPDPSKMPFVPGIVIETPLVEIPIPEEVIKVPEQKSYFDPSIKDIEVAKKMLKINQSANDRNLEYDLSFETVRRLLSYKKCYYTGAAFKDDGIYARSFDRIDSSKGYVEGNVVACTVDINQKKSNLSLEEITILYKKLVLKER
jgi:hypothetical protein